MKYIITLITIILSSNLFAQYNVYSEAFQGVPFEIVWVGDDLHAALFSPDASVQKVNVNDPSTAILVSDLPEGGAWKMDYHEPSNSLYVYSLHNAAINKIDLNDPLPAPFENIVSMPFGVLGMVIQGDILYIAAGRHEIYTMDVNIGGASLSLYYSDSNTDLEFYNPIVYNNDLYFAEKIMNDPNNSIVKIPLNSGNPQKTLVTEGIQGGIQSSIGIQNYMYIGLETAPPHKILKIDLDSSVPTTAETIVSDLPGAPLGLAYKEGTFYVSDGTNWAINSFIDPNLSINEFSTQQLLVYPSPADDVLYLSLETAAKNYQVYSVNGNLLIDGDYTAEGIDVSMLETGIYFITIKDGETKQTKKFIKK